MAEGSYEAALKVLTDSFEHKDLLGVDHLDALLTLTPVNDSHDIEKLRALHDEIAFRINALDGLGLVSDRYAVVVWRVLLKALHPDLGLLYRQRVKESARTLTSDDSPNALDGANQIKKLLDFLRVQVEIHEEGRFDHSG